MGVTIATIVVTETIVCGLAAVPSTALWFAALDRVPSQAAPRTLAFAVLAPFSYALFALCLMPVSAAVSRLTGARTPEVPEMQIAEMSWPMMRWARYVVSIHVVRVFSGVLFRSSPVWTWYLRLNGARVGRRVYVNSVYLSDHNLIEIGDDVVLGADTHLSAHTVEAGVLKIAPVRLGRGVTVGVNTVIDIGVECGDYCQIAALSFVPKYARLEPGRLYGGIPVKLLRQADARTTPAVMG
jgi:acetyltransferase-like isoleucine patch superfamily enzyme